MPNAPPPKDYDALMHLIHERFDEMSRTYQKIAVFVTQNPNDVAMLSVNALANRCGIHASSFVRFAQMLGYKGFKELQRIFHRRLSNAAPGYEARIQALENGLAAPDEKTEQGLLRDLVVRDIAALHDLVERITEADLYRAVRMIERADTVYLIGQLRSAPVVEFLRYVLTVLGQRVVLLDASGGLAAHMARVIGPRDLMLAVSFRHYAQEVVTVAEEAAARGAPVIAITDSTLSPVARAASVLFAVPEHDHAFSRSLAAPMCLAQALTVGLAARLQEDRVSPRIPTVTQES